MIRTLTAVLFAAAVGTTAYALSADVPPKVEKQDCRLGELSGSDEDITLPGCPDDMRSLVDRAAQCQHWMGEEPYDAARGHEIDVALDELRCAKLPDEHREMLNKYKDRSDVLDALEAVDREYSLEF